MPRLLKTDPKLFCDTIHPCHGPKSKAGCSMEAWEHTAGKCLIYQLPHPWNSHPPQIPLTYLFIQKIFVLLFKSSKVPRLKVRAVYLCSLLSNCIQKMATPSHCCPNTLLAMESPHSRVLSTAHLCTNEAAKQMLRITAQ